MNNKNFILNVIKLYQEARISKFKDKRIRRGRSHSISSDVEDLFASFLLKRVLCDVIYVDQPISIKGRRVQFYPDIVIVKNNKITAFCDLKMDLGWKRKELYFFAKNMKIFLNKIKGKDCKIRDGMTKEDKNYSISLNASFNIIVVSDQNINRNVLKSHEEKIKRLGDGVELFILSGKEHPNTYGYAAEELLKEISINDEQFNKLIKKLKTN